MRRAIRLFRLHNAIVIHHADKLLKKDKTVCSVMTYPLVLFIFTSTLRFVLGRSSFFALFNAYSISKFFGSSREKLKHVKSIAVWRIEAGHMVAVISFISMIMKHKQRE